MRPVEGRISVSKLAYVALQAGGAAWRMISRRTLFRSAGAMAAIAPFLPIAAATAAEESAGPGALCVGARVIPLPTTVSPEAQRFLSDGAARLNAMMAASHGGGSEAPPLDNADWKMRIAAADKALDPTIDRMLTSPAKVEWKTMGGVNVAVATPNVMRHPDRARMNIHGGGFAYLGGRYPMGQAAQTAATAGCMTFSVDYRRPPDFPFPAALDDSVAVFRELIKLYDPGKIAISGESAGGNLAATATLKIRDLGLPLPGVVGMLTPVTDLTRQSDTLQTNFGIDTVLTTSPKPSSLDALAVLYGDGHDFKDPYLSPVFADFAKGFPPTFLQSGTRDLLLSDTVRMHRTLIKAGVEAELHVWEGMPHSGFGFFAPEDDEIRQQFLKFVDKHTT